RDALAVDGHRHLERGVDGGDGVGRELDVDDRARDGHDAAALQGLAGVGAGVGDGHVGWLLLLRASSQVRSMAATSTSADMRAWSTRRSEPSTLAARMASAPPTISMISVVMASWRARFMARLYLVIRSSALSVADFMARCWAAKNDAAPSSR